MAQISFDDIQNAQAQMAGFVVQTPYAKSVTQSKITGAEVYLKFENLQFTGSFKDRGALIKLLQLDPGQRARGVIANSAGNHAQGVAYHAQRLGFPVTIVMPVGTPNVKVRQTRDLSAEIVLSGDNVDQAAVAARRICLEQRLTYVHPYDDPAIIAGQGTVVLEMLAAAPDIDTLVIPIGGGGLICGNAIAARGISPTSKLLAWKASCIPSPIRPVTAWPTIAVARPSPKVLPWPSWESLIWR